MTSSHEIDHLLQNATTAQHLHFQRTLLETTFALERRFNAIGASEQGQVEDILAQFSRFCATPPNEDMQARFEDAFPMSYPAPQSYLMGINIVYNWDEDDASIDIARELYHQFLIACHDLWRAHDPELIANMDDEDTYSRYGHWATSHLRRLIEQAGAPGAPSIALPYTDWRQLIDHQRTYSPKQRTLYVALIRDIDVTHHWQCDIPELDMINVVVRGPRHVLDATKDPNWYHSYEDPHMDWYDLLAWETALVRVIDPAPHGLFEMVQQAHPS